MHSNFPLSYHKSASVRCNKSINGISLINRRNLFPSMFPILLSGYFGITGYIGCIYCDNKKIQSIELIIEAKSMDIELHVFILKIHFLFIIP